MSSSLTSLSPTLSSSKSPISSSFVKNIKLIETKINTDFFDKEKINLIDIEGLKRYWCIIEWNEKHEDEISLFIRDFLKIRYNIPIKYLKPSSFSYIAQKANTLNSNDISSSAITIEPLNNDFEKYISLIPISQKLKIGTEFIFNESIPYDADEDGIIPNRKFISSNNLICKDKDAKNPILRNVHIGAMEIGSQLKMKFVVEKTDHLTDGSTFTMINFRRHPDDKNFIINHYNYWHYSTLEILNIYLDYIEHDYKDPILNHNDANDYGANILDKKNLITILKEIIEKLPHKITESGTIEILEKYIV